MEDQRRRRLFAIIPAAGHSRRMGQPKLLLDWGGRTILERLVEALRRPEITDVVVVARNDDTALHMAADRAGARVVRPPVDPPDMRASVEHGLDWVRRQWSPTVEDGWLLIPADHPLVDPAVLNELISHWQTQRAAIVLPTFEGRRGHPTLLQWELAGEVASIPENQGLNWLVRQHADRTLEVPMQTRSVLLDLDTPEEYAAALAEWGPRPANG